VENSKLCFVLPDGWLILGLKVLLPLLSFLSLFFGMLVTEGEICVREHCFSSGFSVFFFLPFFLQLWVRKMGQFGKPADLLSFSWNLLLVCNKDVVAQYTIENKPNN